MRETQERSDGTDRREQTRETFEDAEFFREGFGLKDGQSKNGGKDGPILGAER